MHRKSPPQSAKESSPERSLPPPQWSPEDRMEVVAKLHDLQLVNQRLNDEKSSLQRQLSHILNRLATDRFTSSSSDLQQFSLLIRDVLRPASESQIPAHPAAIAPIASSESASLIGSNGRVSLTEYSSLSDTYEEIILRQNPVRLISLELSSTEEGADSATPVGLSRLTPETDTLAVSGTTMDTPASSTSVAMAIRPSPLSSEASEDLPDWNIQIPPSPSSEYSVETISSFEDVSLQELHRRTEPRTTPNTPVRLHLPTPSLSLPAYSHKLILRPSIQMGTAVIRGSAFRSHEQPAAQEPSETQHRRKRASRHPNVYKFPKIQQDSEISPEEPKLPHGEVRQRQSRGKSVPQPLRRALQRISHKPRVKVGHSDDFLNELFSSSPVCGGESGVGSPPEGLQAAMIAGRSAEVARALSSLSTHLHSYIHVRRHCIPIRNVPLDEVQKKLDALLQSSRQIVERLCKEETSSEEARSVVGIPLTSPTPELVSLVTTTAAPSSPAPPPQPSTSRQRTSSISTEYNIPPTEDSYNNVEKEIDHISIHAGHLYKLSSRFKLWQRFWCVLAEKSLLFYADESESHQWPKKAISLVEIQHIEKRFSGRLSMKASITSTEPHHSSASINAINLVLRDGKIYTLRSQRISETNIWEGKMKQALRRVQAEQIVALYRVLLTTSGWLKRYRRGQSHRVWCMLMGTFLVYSRDSRGRQLTGFRDLSMTYVRCPTGISSGHYGSPTSKFGQEAYESSDSASGAGDCINEAPTHTLALWSPNRDPVYLVFLTEAEFDRWKHHLLTACWFSTPITDSTLTEIEPGSRFVKLWEQLVRPSYENCRIHAETPIKEPISRSFEPTLERGALELSEKLHRLSNLHNRRPERLFDSTEKRPGAMYRLPVYSNKCNLMKEIAQMCFESSGLKDELFLQLVRQATPSTQTLRTMPDIQAGTEPTRRRAARMVDFLFHRDGHRERRRHQTESRRFTSPTCYAQRWIPIIVMWECIAIYSTMFLPSPPVLACLQAHLLRFTSNKESTERAGIEQAGSPISVQCKVAQARSLHEELCRFAAFCSDMLMRCRVRGGRRVVPSCFEIVAISLRNPYTHSLPFSLPIHVHLPSGYEVVSFDGTTKVGQLMASLCDKLDLSEAVSMSLCHCGLYCRISGLQYAFGDVPAKPRLIYLEEEWNVCDVISLYEKTLTRTDQESDFSLEDMTIDLVFLVHAVSKKALTQSSPLSHRLMDLVAHQLHSDLCSGELSLILRGTHFLELTSLMCRCDQSDYAELQRRQEVSLTHLVNRYFPNHCLATWGCNDDQALIELKLLLIDRWTKVCQETSMPAAEDAKRPAAQPPASYAYAMYFWRLHPAGACIRHFPCNMINFRDISVDEMVWLAVSFDRISLLRLCGFNRMVAQPISSGTIEGGVSGMICFKRIPTAQLISFGVQETGAFFLVYSTIPKSRRHRWRERTNRPKGHDSTAQKEAGDTLARGRSASGHVPSFVSTMSEPESNVVKLLFLVRDLSEINELCQVLSFYVENAE